MGNYLHKFYSQDISTDIKKTCENMNEQIQKIDNVIEPIEIIVKDVEQITNCQKLNDIINNIDNIHCVLDKSENICKDTEILCESIDNV